jgi:hypothetical protein
MLGYGSGGIRRLNVERAQQSERKMPQILIHNLR